MSGYIPEMGDIIFLDFDPQVGHEQAKRRPALVFTDQGYNRASGLAIVCPITSRSKSYPFALPIRVGDVDGSLLVDQIKGLDWLSRGASFHSRVETKLLEQARQYLAVLLRIRTT